MSDHRKVLIERLRTECARSCSFDPVIEHSQELLAEPHDERAFEIVAAAFHDHGDARLQEVCEIAIVRWPDNTFAPKFLMEFYHWSGEGGAADGLRQALRVAHQGVHITEALSSAAEKYLMNWEPDRAVQLFTLALARGTNEPSLSSRLALACLRNKELERAALLASQVLEGDIDDSEIFNSCGMVFLGKPLRTYFDFQIHRGFPVAETPTAVGTSMISRTS